MTRLLVALLAVAAAYWVGRDVEWREWMRESDPGPDEMDAVQPFDDWWQRIQPHLSNSMSIGEFDPTKPQPLDWDHPFTLTRRH